jgi:hypothetical protein
MFGISFGNLQKLENKLMKSIEDVNAKVAELGEKADAERTQVREVYAGLAAMISTLQAKILQIQTEGPAVVDFTAQYNELVALGSKIEGVYVPDVNPMDAPPIVVPPINETPTAPLA